MEYQIVDIEFEDRMTCIGQIRKDLGDQFTISVLEYAGDGLWDFNEELEDVPKECISGFYDTVDLEKTGLYERTRTGLYELVDDSDTEYVLPSDTDDDSCSEVSLVDEF
tara:strand:- start:2511 stop:2837 length:327 start_codon:yes stop_codon:yes gene_type:complete